MAFEGLADRLQQTMQKIRGKGKVSEADVKENDERSSSSSFRSRC